MPKVIKFLGLAIAALLSLVIIAIVAFMVWREVGQAENEQAMIIDTPNGIDVLETVSIGGIDQFLEIRGHDIGNPLLLSVHGGPGASNLPYAYLFQRPWEKHFTVVQWEQRGAGLTHGLHGDEIADTVTFERMVADGIEVTEYLLQRFGKDKLILLGHSWGSMLSTHMIKQRPELFYAYVGVGQAVEEGARNLVAYEYVLEQAQAAGDTESVAKLVDIGPPPWGPTPEQARAKMAVQQNLLMPYNGSVYGQKNMTELGMKMLRAPRLPITYGIDYMGGVNLSQDLLQQAMDNFDLREMMDATFDLPIFFFLGRHDYQVPSVLAAEYFEEIQAPVKELVWFERAAHVPQLTRPNAFLKALVDKVRPFAVAPVVFDANPRPDVTNLSSVYPVIKSGQILDPHSLVPNDAETVVQRQLNAYNAHDIEAFVATYATDIKIEALPGTPVLEGHEALRQYYSGLFAQYPNIYAKLVNRSVLGEFVVDEERLPRGAESALRGTAIYQVQDGLIQRVWMTPLVSE